MGEFDEYADVKPASWTAPAAAATGGEFDQYAAAAPAGVSGERKPVDRGVGDAVLRESGNIFGFGPAMAAGIETAARKVFDIPSLVGGKAYGTERFGNAGYEERRRVYEQGLAEARAAHPTATGLTSGARGVAQGLASVAIPGVAAAPAMLTAGLEGGLEGAGESISKGETGAAPLLRSGLGAATGAATTGAIQAAAGGVRSLARRALVGKESEARAKATEALRKQVGNDIVGDVRRASTATARKQMADDVNDIQDVVTADPQLENVLHESRQLAPTKLGEAIDVVDSRLEPWRKERPQLYKALDQQIGGGVRSGTYVEHLEKSAAALEATGEGEDRQIAEQLRHRAEIIKDSASWGGKSDVFDPNMKIGDDTAGNLVSAMEKARATAKTPEQVAAYDAHIEAIKQQATTKGYNPDTIVPAEKLRDNVTDLQNTAFRAYGGINGTNAWRRARETASYAESFLRGVKDSARQANPDLLARIDEHDKNVSALLHIKEVLTQKFNKATVDELGGSEGNAFARKVEALSHAKRNLLPAIAARVGVAGKNYRYGLLKEARDADRGVQFADDVLQSLRKGLSLGAAVNAAQAATQE